MGRKSIDKERKPLSKKATLWVEELFFILQDKKLNQLTLDEIAASINKSKSTIYTYFKTKEEIYETVILMVLSNLEDAIYEELPENVDIVDLYEELFFKICKGIDGMSIGFLNQIKRFYPNVWAKVYEFTNNVLNTLNLIYVEGMNLGRFNQFNTKLLIAMDEAFIMSIMTDVSRFKEDNLSLENIVNQYFKLRMKALIIA
ncbi:TetR/AcrR family transcriptional regulator [Tenacibaculum sp. M341]|uniref:TetR/AcrR family transcriptional regulator n=1 Tax=Tenacibaculum sp. M341 TaxID=2530339 RepID=UPI00104AB032|nr:TetR/AcrR family transcriptional regulator [Tenacibaculum sp. M341]TCI90131.1 TetR/AcrR family transcriptional regulator [Tenacibaculum sp. M341]